MTQNTQNITYIKIRIHKHSVTIIVLLVITAEQSNYIDYIVQFVNSTAHSVHTYPLIYVTITIVLLGTAAVISIPQLCDEQPAVNTFIFK
jgi:hypothetical protein